MLCLEAFNAIGNTTAAQDDLYYAFGLSTRVNCLFSSLDGCGIDSEAHSQRMGEDGDDKILMNTADQYKEPEYVKSICT